MTILNTWKWAIIAAQIHEWIKIGTDLGLKENELQVFVKEQQTMAREEREKGRT